MKRNQINVEAARRKKEKKRKHKLMMQLKFYFGFYLNKTHQIEANNNVQACFNDI